MKRLRILIILLFVAGNLHASFDTKKGARPLAMGGAFVAAGGSDQSMNVHHEVFGYQVHDY